MEKLTVKRDPYRERAALMFGIEESAVTADQRAAAKAETFRESYSNALKITLCRERCSHALNDVYNHDCRFPECMP